MNPKVDWYFNKVRKWQVELRELRKIVLSSGLTEELKWGVPCYVLGKSNVVLIHAFKDYCAIMFIKGALLKDPKHILIQQTENVQSGRQARFSSIKEIQKLKPVLNAYIKEAIKVEKAGLKVEKKQTEDYKMPEEFKNKLIKIPALKNAFEALTPGRQRGYILYFSSAKQSKTREARVEKYMDQILDGLGLED